jgi:hypothetical protein
VASVTKMLALKGVPTIHRSKRSITSGRSIDKETECPSRYIDGLGDTSLSQSLRDALDLSLFLILQIGSESHCTKQALGFSPGVKRSGNKPTTHP